MRLPRTDLVPLLAIIAGGAIGASLSFGFLLSSRSDDVPAPDPVVAPSATAESATRMVLSKGLVLPVDRIEVDPVEISPDGQWIAYQSNASGEPRMFVRMVDGKDGSAPVVVWYLLPREPGPGRQP